MSFYKITFHLDGTGLYFDPHEPIHIDALLAWALAPRQNIRHTDRSTIPDLVRLPVKRSMINGSHVWHASALFPEGEMAEGIWHWRKRFRQGRAELTTGSPNLTNGQYRDWQMPVPLLLCHSLVGYANGHRRDLRNLLGEVRYLGKKRAHGHGRVIGLDIEQCDADYSLVKNGRAMRWLPSHNGTRLVRPMPPYWNPHGRVTCCEVGDEFNLPREDGSGGDRHQPLTDTQSCNH